MPTDKSDSGPSWEQRQCASAAREARRKVRAMIRDPKVQHTPEDVERLVGALVQTFWLSINAANYDQLVTRAARDFD